MMFWLFATALTLAAIVIGFLPLTRAKRVSADANMRDAEFDQTVYRDQLSELNNDKSRGLIGEAEYEQARVEIARRLLASEDMALSGGTKVERGGQFTGYAFALVFVPAMAVLVYSEVGSPQLEAQPLAARLQADSPIGGAGEVALMLERAEEHLRVNPKDVRGWDVIAPVYLQVNRPTKAATAYQNAITLDGATSDRLAGLGEAIVAQAGGIVNEEARRQFVAAIELDETNSRAQFFIGLASAQSGDLDYAATVWRAVASGPGGSRWVDMARGALTQLDADDEANLAVAPSIDPDAAAVVSALPQEEQAAMIQSMVDGLDARLRDNPDDLEGWLRLIRARVVLGQRQLAVDALQISLAEFEADQSAIGALDALAEELDLKTNEGAS
ncbi:MAG: c-type cytochrome biogenesis protein CcmI [Pseudomonadota bacterium]